MDPSNNNAFDSFGNNAGAGNGASVGGASAGAGIGSGATITSPNAGATNSGSIVSSGATAVNNEYTSNSFPEGGLTIGGDKKRSRKGLIIAGIVFFVLAIGGGLAALAAMNGVFGGGSGNSGNNGNHDNNLTLKESFNKYINYILNGIDSVEDLPEDFLADLVYPYYKQIDKEQYSSYIDNAQQKYDMLADLYKSYGETVELLTLKALFQDYVSEYYLDYDTLKDYFLSNGFEKTREYIDSHYAVKNSTGSFENYRSEAKQFSEYELSIINDMAENNCFDGDKEKEGCFTVSDDMGKSISDMASTMTKFREMLFVEAYDTADDVYQELYQDGADLNE